MVNEYVEKSEKERPKRIHYIRYARLRCGKCKSYVSLDVLGHPTRCCGSFTEAVQ